MFTIFLDELKLFFVTVLYQLSFLVQNMFDELSFGEIFKRDRDIYDNLFVTYIDLLLDIIFSKLVSKNCTGCQTLHSIWPQYHNLCSLNTTDIIATCLPEALTLISHEVVDKRHEELCQLTITPPISYFESFKWKSRESRDLTFNNPKLINSLIKGIEEQYHTNRFMLDNFSHIDFHLNRVAYTDL